MKILHYAWGAYNDKILYAKLFELGCDIVQYTRKCVNYTRDMDLAGELMGIINAQGIEAIISFDYFPIISMAANVCNIPYYSWVYDSPHMTLQAKCINLPNNIVGVFDKELVDELRAFGINTVRHVPLGVDIEWFDRSIRECKDNYDGDVSFVGSMYTDSHNYYDELKNNDDSWQRIDAYVNCQKFDYTNNHENMLKEIRHGKSDFDYLNERMKEAGYVLDEDYYDLPEENIGNQLLRRRVTVVERKELLTKTADFCNDNGYSFKLYTGSDVLAYEQLEKSKCSPVDYLKQMPKVFRSSKINLNITLRSIRSGIPLRALDIMASGGFLLSNPQGELAEYLEENKDYVAYYSIEDCLDKIQFYLKNDSLREKIALNGYEKMSKIFSYEKGLESLFSDIGSV